MEIMEFFKIIKRYFDTHHTIRKLFTFTILIFFLLWIFGFRFYSQVHVESPGELNTCLERNLYKLQGEKENLDSNILHVPPLDDEMAYMPYVGNGYIGTSVSDESVLKIKPRPGRVLNAVIPFRPMVSVTLADESSRKEATVSQFRKGTVQKFSCIERTQKDVVEAVSMYYAHRTYPSVFEQDVTIRNTGSENVIVQFDQLGYNGDPPFKMEVKKFELPGGKGDYQAVVASGVIETERGSIAVAIASKKVPNAVEVKGNKFVSFRFVSVINYSYLTSKKEFENVRAVLTDKSEQELQKVMSLDVRTFYELHEKAWNELWTTGFYISTSRAVNALNGDKINATMYNVLSQVRAPLFEVNVPLAQISEAHSVLSYAEGCYGGHHTLQAPNLWSSLESETNIFTVSNLWLITLEKLGCHRLLRGGASGVIQAMVLSFGAFKFSNHHLEFNTEPKDLHRDYLFRRIGYGNATHVNISVSVGEDNKAVLSAALDRSDRDYFACDAGCLDAPVELAPTKKQFPVKLTDPVTSILYITSDRKHVEELRLSIHVKEVFEAPAHETHVISMHKHGSGYGAMSTMFWVGLSLLIILFHLFLFHLVYTEYFSPSPDKYRTRYVE
ncbi:unnamed protein product [Orchesella dallaii]|uniref:Uncharacterized protein n=1 Tax=Orchesella dallaii TaxID=48710 RepID=A0ABP1Q6L8_9HEXA